MEYKKRFYWFVSVCLVNLSLTANAQNVDLKSGWQYRETKTTKWFPATVPGEIHTDLLKNKTIPDPFYRDNEKKCNGLKRKIGSIKLLFKLQHQH